MRRISANIAYNVTLHTFAYTHALLELSILWYIVLPPNFQQNWCGCCKLSKKTTIHYKSDNSKNECVHTYGHWNQAFSYKKIRNHEARYNHLIDTNKSILNEYNVFNIWEAWWSAPGSRKRLKEFLIIITTNLFCKNQLTLFVLRPSKPFFTFSPRMPGTMIIIIIIPAFKRCQINDNTSS